ncbi:hypothetical protein ONE63_009368 [Megalurothrips usitatus]|uniref:ABC transporter domain-containing protein n=1 Tax=Megalurothrips usitatus TaxID=439358 RepID=A0AAV7XJE8_9NEOP|nr:hypothetical protein ONE63_009368 [Megalurothrips usitatus]
MDTNSDGAVLESRVEAGAAAGAGVTIKPGAVIVKGATITYPLSKTPVLNGLSMSVAEGTIYGLLGASGCGKTTLLTCIVGRRQLDSGSVRVLGLTPGAPGSGLPGPTIGYMPQELALHGSFTVAETYRYFGWISGMSKTEVQERTRELLRLLDIPYPNKLVGELSGGQQRRVSLGVALLAKPPILILDEPTVGVDPTLRSSIWDLLVNETKMGRTTVIITTHYIEEARQSDRVGLMRDGTLLDEDSPESLLTRYGAETMEDVFLKLSVRQQRLRQRRAGSHAIAMVDTKPLDDKDELPPPAIETVKVVDDPSLLKSKVIRMKSDYSSVAPSVWKMVVFTWRNKTVIGVLGVLPIIVSLLFAFAVGGEPRGLHMAVVNEDYAKCKTLGPPDFPADCDVRDPLGLSCRYLSRLDKHMFILDYFNDVESATAAVRRGQAWGALHFPANYSRSVSVRRKQGEKAPDSDIDNSEISVWMDMSNQQVSDTARAALGKTALDYFRDVQLGCKGNPDFRALPMQFNQPIYGQYKLNFPDFFAPAIILSIVYNVNVIYTMAGFLDDKKDGFMERSISSGVNVLEILGAHVVVDTVMMIFSTFTTLTMICGFLGFENQGSMWTIILFCAINGLCGMFQGYFIASLFNTDFEAVFIAMGIYFPTLLLSGLMWPLEGMHWLLRSVSWLLPLNLATTAIRAVMNRGWGLAMATVVNGVISSILWLLFFVAITVITLRLKKTMLK